MAKKMVQISAADLKKLNRKLAAAEKKKAAKAARQTDGFSPFLAERYRQALREVWYRSSSARKLVVKRCDIGGGYSRCEGCRKKVPKIYVDHIIPCGTLDGGYIARLSVPSNRLQGLCKQCHDIKTKEDRARIARAEDYY